MTLKFYDFGNFCMVTMPEAFQWTASGVAGILSSAVGALPTAYSPILYIPGTMTSPIPTKNVAVLTCDATHTLFINIAAAAGLVLVQSAGYSYVAPTVVTLEPFSFIYPKA
jgi:hypothetical protein